MNEHTLQVVFMGLILAMNTITTYLLWEKEQPLYPLAESRAVETTIACTSDSMGLNFRCGETIKGETIKENDTLYPGSIYVYNTTNGTNVIHRLVACLDNNCNETIFKGDNNAVAEEVHRKQILYRVTQKEVT